MPLTRRQILRRRRIVVFGGLALVLATGFYLPLTLLAPLGAASAQVLPYTSPTVDAAALTFPNYGATAVGAVGFDGPLAVSGSADPLPIASITKVITSLIVLEKKPLAIDAPGPDISFTAADVALYKSYLARNGKVEPVRPGMVLTQRQVMDLTLVSSANNYTASLVNWAFGSEEAYIPIANAWLQAHSMTSTSLEDATGMSPNNRSTASDLIILGKLALAQPLIAAITSTKTIAVPGVGTIDNTNDLLGIDGIHGIKTGTLDEAGACLLFTADYLVGATTVTVVGVMLGGVNHPSLDRDIQTLLGTVKAGFHEVQLVTAGQAFATYATDWGAKSSAVATAAKSVVVWGGTAISMSVHAADAHLSPRGTDAGDVTFTVGTEQLTVPLELDTAITDPGPEWRLSHPAELF